MPRVLLVLTVTLLAAALPASATCDRAIDSRAYDDNGDSSFCWLSGMICYYCWGANPDEHCAANWEPCVPTSPKKGPHPIVVSAPELRPLSRCAVKTLQEPQQVKLEHVL